MKSTLYLFAAMSLAAASVTPATMLFTDVSSDSLTAGDPVTLTVRLVVPPGARVDPPEPERDFGDFTVRDWSSTTDQRDDSDSISYQFIVTRYQTGRCSIPALPFVEQRDTAADTLYTAPIPMRIASVIDVDSASLRDIRGPLTTGAPPAWPLWALIAGVLIAAGAVLIHVLRRRATRAAAAPPPRPPWEEAIAALAALEAKGYLSAGRIREHVFELSEILKRYLGRRYQTRAAEWTTEEMLDWIRTTGLPGDIRDSLRWFFETSHMVKFARWSPDAAVIERFSVEVRAVLDKTRPAPRPREDAQAEATS
jgi:hypothetical protein